MSKRSRKRLNRSQKKKHKIRKQQKERIESRKAASTQIQDILPETFVQKYFIQLLLVLLAVFGFLIYRSLDPGQWHIERARVSVTSKLLNRSYDWQLQYPYGYKIIALTDTEIIQTNYDTLPRELEINWKKLIVSRIEANQLAEKIESIKFALTNIRFQAKNISGMSITASVSKRKGAAKTLAQFGDLEFRVEIIEETDNYLFCLFGLK